MGRKKMEEHNVRKLSRTDSGESASYYVTLPIELVRKFGWQENQKLIVRKAHAGDKIVVEDWEA